MLGTFPPAEKRWCMPWYYPNFQNDMWRIFGIIYFQDKLHFVDVEKKTYRLDAIKEFLGEKGVAIYDTAQQVIRSDVPGAALQGRRALNALIAAVAEALREGGE